LPKGLTEHLHSHAGTPYIKLANQKLVAPDSKIFSITQFAHSAWGHVSNERLLNTLTGTSSDYLTITLSKNQKAQIKKHLRDPDNECESCQLTKSPHSTKLPNYFNLDEKYRSVFAALNSDIFTFGEAKFVAVMDVYSKYMFISKIPDGPKNPAWLLIKDIIENIFMLQYTVVTFISDNGSEYNHNDFKAYLQSRNITHVKSIPYVPKSNSLIERAQGTIMNMQAVYKL